jgi:hypothetical protein
MFVLPAILIMLFHPEIALAQHKSDISGSISFRGNGLPLTNAKVWVHEQSSTEIVSVPVSGSARFTSSLAEGYYDLFVTSPGFVPFCRKLWIRNGTPITLDIKLEYDFENAQD